MRDQERNEILLKVAGMRFEILEDSFGSEDFIEIRIRVPCSKERREYMRERDEFPVQLEGRAAQQAFSSYIAAAAGMTPDPMDMDRED